MHAPAPDSPANEDLGSLTVALAMACPHCASPTPVNGPLQTVSCNACLKELPVGGLAEQLESSAEGYDWLNSPFLSSGQQAFQASDVQCGSCDALIPIEPHLSLVGQTTTIPCPSCAAPCPTHPAPDWLVERLPSAVQVFGGDAPPGSGVALETSEASPEAVLMSCPGCAGGLQITADLARTMTCKYCGSSVFIPDPLWKRLHPVRLLRRWTLLFRGGVLETHETMEDRLEEEEDRLEEKEDAAVEKASEPRSPTRVPAATTQASRRFRVDILSVASTLAIGGLALNILGAPMTAPLSWWPNIALIVLGALLVGAGIRKTPRSHSRRRKGQMPPGRLLVVAGGVVAFGGVFLGRIVLALTVQ